MKCYLVLLLLAGNSCLAQRWEAEVMLGTSGYNGDLTQKLFSTNTLGPSSSFNLKYNFNDLFLFRTGITWAHVSADDKYNRRADLKERNLNFRTNIWEVNACLEVNLLEPDFFSVYPYVFAGLGVYHFNPFTFDNAGKKVYLQPLGTEGQGLPAYPDRKPYSLTQLCLPFGGGVKINLNKRVDLAYEISGRSLFTDYLDDVSTTYVNTQTLMNNRRPMAAELAYRQKHAPFPSEGDIRGNPKVKDWYFITGLKVLMRLGRDQ